MVQPVGPLIFNSYLQGQEERRRQQMEGLQRLQGVLAVRNAALEQQRAAELHPLQLQALKAKLAAANAPVLGGPGSQMMHPQTGQPIGPQVPFKPAPPTDQWGPVEPGPGGSQIQKNLTTGQVRQVVGREQAGTTFHMPPQESAYAKGFGGELGKRDAEYEAGLQKGRQTAFAQQSQIQRMKAALESDRFEPGVFSDSRYFLSQAALFLGQDPEKIGLGLGAPETADTIIAASNQVGVELARELSRVTNMSLTFIKDSLPNLSRTKEGNMIVVEVMDRLAKRKVELAELADRYMSDYGTLRPKGQKSYYATASEFERDNPVIDNKLRNRIMGESRRGKDVQIRSAPKPDALPPTNKKGWVLMEDAKGNRAYVGPGGEIEEVSR